MLLKPRTTESDDPHLIDAAKKDPSRFAELYEANFTLVYAYVVRRVRDRATAEDLTSEVFYNALSNLSRFEWRGVPFSAWLIRIAANVVTDRWQRLSRESGREFPDAGATEDMGQVERRAALFQLVDRLPENQRIVIVHRFVEQKSIREIARELQKTEGAVKQLQFRALEHLRAQMEGADA
jgi:RNA polymerase sigma-70 factor (ECF subfamily)